MRYAAPLIVGIVGCAILVALGVWQVQRLAWKQGILAEIDARMAADPVPVPAAPDPDVDRYLPVAEQGEMTGDELHVLVSGVADGAGYRVIAVFEEDGRRLLVDRGFVPLDAKDAARRTGEMIVTGTLVWPDEVDRWTPEPDLEDNIWFARDVPAMAAALGAEPVLIAARSRTDPGVTPLPVDTSTIPNNHLNYAITWFSLAVVWLAMTGYWMARIRRKA
ncbi:SURF1 family protein [Aestuariibius sp. 2305UL40-4]|uniref:SURF1 family protein n=1 Tax=Aestuariibius violaceus TaxID=3234132 RepID=UPI00345EAF9F